MLMYQPVRCRSVLGICAARLVKYRGDVACAGFRGSGLGGGESVGVE